MTKITSYILLLLFCSLPYLKADIPPPMITVSGNGEVRVEPDQALVSIAVEWRDVSVQELLQKIDTTAADIIAHLQDQNIENKDIQTSYLNVQPYYNYSEWDTGNTDPDYYIGQKAMAFVLRNLSNYDTIMSGLYDLGLNRVDGITFRVTDKDAPKLEAKKRAAANAKEIAAKMVEELGVQLGKVYSISEYTYYNDPIPIAETANMDVAMGSDGGKAAAGPSISGGEVVFTSNVNVVYYIVQ